MTGLLDEQYKELYCVRPQDSSFFFLPIEMHADKPQKPNFINSSFNPIDEVTVGIVLIVHITIFGKIYTLKLQCW